MKQGRIAIPLNAQSHSRRLESSSQWPAWRCEEAVVEAEGTASNNKSSESRVKEADHVARIVLAVIRNLTLDVVCLFFF